MVVFFVGLSLMVVSSMVAFFDELQRDFSGPI